MELTPEQIIEAALKLPPADQVALADTIYLNTKAPWADDPPLPDGWDAEIARRLKDIDEGKVKLLDGPTVMKELKQWLDDGCPE